MQAGEEGWERSKQIKQQQEYTTGKLNMDGITGTYSETPPPAEHSLERRILLMVGAMGILTCADGVIKDAQSIMTDGQVGLTLSLVT